MISPPNVREGYNRWASVYDHDANPMLVLEEPVVKVAAGSVLDCVALDLGCGTGRHASWLAEAGAKVTALDFSSGMLEVASQKPNAEKIRFIEHDLHKPLPFDADFDLIICGLVLEHISEIHPFFSEILRVLKPGGRAIISTMHPAMFLKGSKARFTDPESGKTVEPGSFNHSISSCVMAAVECGFNLFNLTEHSPDTELASQFPRAEKYIGWPMLVVLSLSKASAG